ncbi:MAG: hypothetical protein ACLRXC_09245 [[Clostridium] leptum]
MTGPPRELTRSERAAIRRLVTGLCASYGEREKLCLPLIPACFANGGLAAFAGILSSRCAS